MTEAMIAHREYQPPRTLLEMERRARLIKSDWGFSLRALILASNSLGVAIAVIVWTQGLALLLLVCLAFAAPVLAGLYMVFTTIRDRILDRILIPKRVNATGTKSPFDD